MQSTNKGMRSFRFPSRPFLLVCIFILVPSIVSAFAPPKHTCSHRNVRHFLHWNSHSSSKRSRVAYQNGRRVVFDALHHSSLFNTKNDDENDDDLTAPSSDDNNDKARAAGKKIGRQFGFGILSIFGSALQLASWLISAGLVFNIFGYGYQFDREAQYGVKIDTLKNIRQDNQMRNEFERMGRGRQSPDPLRSLQKQQDLEGGKID